MNFGLNSLAFPTTQPACIQKEDAGVRDFTRPAIPRGPIHFYQWCTHACFSFSCLCSVATFSSFARRLAVSPASQSATRSLHVTVPVAGSRQFSPAFWHVEGAPEKKQTPPPAKPVKSDPASGTVPVGQLFHEIQQRAGKGKTPPISMLHSLCASVNEEAHTRLLSDALKLYAFICAPNCALINRWIC